MVLLFVLTIVSLNCAFAAEMNNDTDSVQTFDETVISDDVLTDDNVGSFQDLNSIIENANSGDTVVLEKNYTYDSASDSNFTSGIVVDKQLTIDGDGKTVDANNLARIFNVTSNNVSIKNINFINGYYTDDNGQAGCVVWNGESGELKNCNFDNSYAKIAGAVLWNGDNGLVDGCNFSSNSAMTTAGAIYWDGANGRINNSYFSKNHVTTKGGALYSSYNDNITIENCIFESNYASLYAGAIAFDYVSANIINSTFKGNYLVWSLNGGAIQFTGNSSNLCNLSGCTFESNRAGTGTSIYSTIPLMIEDTTFSDAASSKTIATTSDLTLNGNTLNNNNTVFVNGGKLLSPATVVLNSSSLEVDEGSTVTLSGKIFDDNNNTIILKSIDFLVNNESVSATFASDGTFAANYSISQEKSYDVTVNITDKLDAATVYPVTLKTLEMINISVDVFYAIEPVAIINVSSPVDGTYNVSVNGKNSTIEISDGVGYGVFELEAGDYNLTVSFKDTITSYKTISFTVNEYKIESEISITLISGDFTIEGILKDKNGDIIPNAEIKYSIAGNDNVTVTTDDNGIFTFNTTESGLVEIFYDGNDTILGDNISITLKYSIPSRVNVTIVGEDFTQYAVDYYVGERGGYFKVRLVDVDGNALANKSVKIGFNGVVYEEITDDEGWAQLQINLRGSGTYTFAVGFLGDDGYYGDMKVYSIRINKKPVTITAAAKTYKATAKTKKYTVTLKTIAGSSYDGNIYFASAKKVTLKVNGKTYTAKTDAKGQATFNLKIAKKGKYAAVISFAGDNTYSAVSKTVKSITIK